MMSSIRTAPAATLRRLAHLQRLLEPGAIQPAYQAIVRLSDLEPIGYEGLARFPYADGLESMPPDVTLAAAGEIGLRGDLEVACWAAMAAVGSPPAGRLLFANISSDALAHPGLIVLASRLPSRLVIEITTEQPEAKNYAVLRERLAPWVARGAQVAVDDTGAGYDSLQHVVELRPDFLKLPRSLISHIDGDAGRQALLRGVGAFAREVGAVIVATGVERREELEVLRESDVDFAQGYLFGRPGAPWPEVTRVEEPGRRRPAGLSDSAVLRLHGVDRALLAAETVKGAVSAVVDHLAQLGVTPAVYLQHGERLRVVASRGYWALHDGLPPEAGVVGRAYRTGATAYVADVSASGEYLGALPAVKEELAVPVRTGSRVVGVLNVESCTAISDSTSRETERCAGLLARRLAELGTREDVSAGQRLARAATRTAAVEDPDALVREVAATALEVSGMESVVVALRDGQGVVHVQHAAGPFADAFAGLSAAELAVLAAWVDPGTTMVTMGDAGGKALPVTEPLRRAGAGALLVVPLAVGRAKLGFLALADRSSLPADTERTELMELLGVQTAAQLRGLAAVSELRDRAARDPLTGLGHRASFHARLPRCRRTAAEAGRQVAVVLADVDGLSGINERTGHTAGDDVLRRMAELLHDVSPDGARAFRVGGDEFALLLEADGRGAAQELAWQLQAQARERLGTTLSIGVAVAAAAETDADLLGRAGQAIAEVKRRGRDGVALAAPPLVTAD